MAIGWIRAYTKHRQGLGAHTDHAFIQLLDDRADATLNETEKKWVIHSFPARFPVTEDEGSRGGRRLK